MSVHPVWDNPEKTIVRHVFEGRWTIEDIRVSSREAWDMMGTVQHTVHAILDFTQGNTLPSGGVLAQTNRIATLRPANAGIVVVVTTSYLIQALATAFEKIYGRFHPRLRYYVVGTLEEAYALIAAQSDETRETPQPPFTREGE